eukprot:237980-Prorocentrum_lima.AAC.1
MFGGCGGCCIVDCDPLFVSVNVPCGWAVPLVLYDGGFIGGGVSLSDFSEGCVAAHRYCSGVPCFCLEDGHHYVPWWLFTSLSASGCLLYTSDAADDM